MDAKELKWKEDLYIELQVFERELKNFNQNTEAEAVRFIINKYWNKK